MKIIDKLLNKDRSQEVTEAAGRAESIRLMRTYCNELQNAVNFVSTLDELLDENWIDASGPHYLTACLPIAGKDLELVFAKGESDPICARFRGDKD